MRWTFVAVFVVFVVGCGSETSPTSGAGKPSTGDFGFTVNWPGPPEETVTPVGLVYERKYTGVHTHKGGEGEAIYSAVVFEYTADELRQSSAAQRRARQLDAYLNRSIEVTRTDFAFGPGKVEAVDLRYRQDDTYVRRRAVFGEKRLYTVTVASKTGWGPIDTEAAKGFIESFSVTQ